MVKAYCIKEEEAARFNDSNFAVTVPKVIEENDTDVLVLQTGSIEITDLKINEAMMDTKRALTVIRENGLKRLNKTLQISLTLLKKLLPKMTPWSK